MKARIEQETGEPIIILTTKEASANTDKQVVFTLADSHNETSIEYIKEKCRLPKTQAEKAKCRQLLIWYRLYTCR